MTDHMGLAGIQRVEDRERVGNRDVLAVGRAAFRYSGRRIAARGIGDAPVVVLKFSDLLGPGPVIAGEFVDKQNRGAGTVLLVIQPGAVGR